MLPQNLLDYVFYSVKRIEYYIHISKPKTNKKIFVSFFFLVPFLIRID